MRRSLTEGLTWASNGQDSYEMPSQVAISKAPVRLGPKPLAELFTRVCGPMGTVGTPGALYLDWRLVSIDGTTIDVADTPANAGVFGRAGTGRGEGSAFAQLRIVALGECVTHAIIAAAMDSYDVGEVTLAKGWSARWPRGCWSWPTAGLTAHPLFAAAAEEVMSDRPCKGSGPAPCPRNGRKATVDIAGRRARHVESVLRGQTSHEQTYRIDIATRRGRGQPVFEEQIPAVAQGVGTFTWPPAGTFGS